MKVILYIGHHKVGSTALQAFLGQNVAALMRAGLLYPAVESQGFSHMLRRALQPDAPRSPLSVNMREPHSALAYRMMAEVSDRKVPPQFRELPAVPQMIAALRNQAAQLDPDTVLLCSEVFSNFADVAPDLIDRVKAIWPEADWQVYCALRRPDDYLVSWHGQRLKAGERLPPLSDCATGYLDTIHFDYRKALEPWIARFGAEHVTIRDYAQVAEAGGSVKDFCRQTALDLPRGLFPQPRANPSLHRAVMEIARQANEALPPASAGRLRRFLMRMGGELDLPEVAQVEMLGERLRARLLERFRPIHGWLTAETGADGFFPDPEDLARPRPVPERAAMGRALDQLDAARLAELEDDAARGFVAALRERR